MGNGRNCFLKSYCSRGVTSRITPNKRRTQENTGWQSCVSWGSESRIHRIVSIMHDTRSDPSLTMTHDHLTISWLNARRNNDVCSLPLVGHGGVTLKSADEEESATRHVHGCHSRSPMSFSCSNHVRQWSMVRRILSPNGTTVVP